MLIAFPLIFKHVVGRTLLPQKYVEMKRAWWFEPLYMWHMSNRIVDNLLSPSKSYFTHNAFSTLYVSLTSFG